MKLLLDSGDPQEYKEIAALAKAHGFDLWMLEASVRKVNT